ncbi:974_t:CDS:2 [Entrophospora sp. SA101]|nr:1614_t:CDS:2 [Entrophospora sp. SA101]CAJ0753901.1 974_t:CDS:2 [Entrophospora sp. SA101]CAJ0838824.1 3851_t:CDS:2 [Entrophospora sp. SA101]CAJ0843147.1 1682_t:CDS:2 [Entrophospora sp. SA101]
MTGASKEVTVQQQLTPLGNAVAGSLGALLALTITYPLDIIKTRLQVQSKNISRALSHHEYYDSTLDAIIKITSKEGIFGLYAGLPAGLIGVASTNFAYFYWYSFLRTKYQVAKGTTSLSTMSELLVGALAGALAQIFTIPVSVITTRQQTTNSKERKDLIGTAKEIIGEDGVKGLWKGLKPSLILCVNPAITYGAFERFKDILSKRLNTSTLSPAIDVLKKVLETDGILGWYRGMQAQISKAVLSQALLFYVKEYTTRYTILLFALISRLIAKRRSIKN